MFENSTDACRSCKSQKLDCVPAQMSDKRQSSASMNRDLKQGDAPDVEPKKKLGALPKRNPRSVRLTAQARGANNLSDDETESASPTPNVLHSQMARGLKKTLSTVEESDEEDSDVEESDEEDSNVDELAAIGDLRSRKFKILYENS